jgi:hypothetical protein
VEANWNRVTGKDWVTLSIAWREIGGLPVAASPTCKYCVSIIRDLIPRGSVDLVFASGGVCCNIEIPLDPDATHPRHMIPAALARRQV